jgi:hypothetical protein
MIENKILNYIFKINHIHNIIRKFRRCHIEVDRIRFVAAKATHSNIICVLSEPSNLILMVEFYLIIEKYSF